MAVILKRPRALADLGEIWAYIAADNVAAADNFAELIDKRLRALSRQPDMGRARPELARDLRSFPVGRYVIFYFPLPNGVDIIRVLHGSRDIEAVLQDGE